jgi:hypothetical protein
VRDRSIESFGPADEQTVREVFDDFRAVLGPVGAVKSLHLLAPRYFPLWDNAIAVAYGVGGGSRGTPADRYLRMFRIAQAQVANLGDGELALSRNPLKAIDEYNYCRFTKGWIS